MNVYQQIVKEINEASNIVITAHRSPDGDSIGSSLGLLHFIRNLGKDATICHPDPAPEFLNWLEETASVITMQEHTAVVEKSLDEADLIFCLDYNGTNRVGEEMQELLEKATAKKIMIDHHLNPEDFADIMVSDTNACSTAELIYELIEQSGNAELLDAKTGTPLYLGILTDTGTFRFASVRPRTHEILGKIIASGVQHHLIHEQLSDNNTADRLRLQGYAMSEKLEIMANEPVAIVSMTAAELERFNFQKGDTDGIANLALSIKGIKAAIFLAEKDGKIKMSFRSKGEENPVNTLAANHFDGGGHANASGGISHLSMEETLDKLRKLIPGHIASNS